MLMNSKVNEFCKFESVYHKNFDICLYEGDITKFKADCVVNPADPKFNCSGGVARALCESAGDLIRREFYNYLQIKNYLNYTEVLTTDSFNLSSNYKNILNIASPGVGFVSNYLIVLKETFKSILFEAFVKLKHASIALPFIGTGLNRISLNNCIASFLNCLDEFVRDQGSRLSDTTKYTIYFVNVYKNDLLIVRTFLDASIKRSNNLLNISHNNYKQHRQVAGCASSDDDDDGGGGTQTTTLRRSVRIKNKKRVDQRKCDSDDDDDVKSQPSKKSKSRSRSVSAENDAKADDYGSDYDNVDEKCAIERNNDKSDHDDDDNCVICMDKITNKKTLDLCKHSFCKDCIDDYFSKAKPVCPSCGKIYGIEKGNQPDGTMRHRVVNGALPGYEKYKTIQIHYSIRSGTQGPNHPNPGQPFYGTDRIAFLPDCPEGREVLKLLEKAFENKLIFTVGSSRTTGANNVVTWNDIHHKTSMHGGSASFGYPDPTYLNRVKQELAAKGIK